MSLKSNDAIKKSQALALWRGGWNYGEGFAPPDSLVKKATDLISWAFRNPDGAPNDCEVFPGTEGEILVVFYYGSETLEVELTRKNNIIGESGD